jgi:hypothetical protein
MWEMWSIGLQPYNWLPQNQQEMIAYLASSRRLPKPDHADEEM